MKKTYTETKLRETTFDFLRSTFSEFTEFTESFLVHIFGKGIYSGSEVVQTDGRNYLQAKLTSPDGYCQFVDFAYCDKESIYPCRRYYYEKLKSEKKAIFQTPYGG